MALDEEKLDYHLIERKLNHLAFSGNMVKINEYEFIVPSDCTFQEPQERRGIFKYNTMEDKWSVLLLYPGALKITDPIISYDSECNTVYLYSSNGRLIRVNLVERIFEIYDDVPQMSRARGKYPTLFILHNHCHLIGGSCDNSYAHDRDANGNNYHLEIGWSGDDSYHSYVSYVYKIFEFTEWQKGSTHHGIIHLKSRNEVMLFGGYDCTNAMGYDTIWIFDTKRYEWQQLYDVKLPQKMHSFGYILSENERYCILFGGKNRDIDNLSNIYIWDLHHMIFYESVIKAPSGGCHAVLMHNEKDQVLVCGYIRNMEKCLRIHIPNDVIRLVIIYHKTENVHIMNDERCPNRYHYVLNVNDILDAPKLQI
eukprot:291901_1